MYLEVEALVDHLNPAYGIVMKPGDCYVEIDREALEKVERKLVRVVGEAPPESRPGQVIVGPRTVVAAASPYYWLNNGTRCHGKTAVIKALKITAKELEEMLGSLTMTVKVRRLKTIEMGGVFGVVGDES